MLYYPPRDDRLGKLKLSRAGVSQRNRMVRPCPAASRSILSPRSLSPLSLPNPTHLRRLARFPTHPAHVQVYNAVRACGARLVATMGGGYPRNLDPASEPFTEMIQTHMDVYRDLVSHFATEQ